MNLNIIKNNKLILIALILFIGLFIFFLSRGTKPNQSSIPANVENINGTQQPLGLLEKIKTNSNVKNQNYSTINVNINDTLEFAESTANIYKYESSNLYTKDNLLTLVDALGMTVLKTSQSPIQGEVIIATGVDSALTIEADLKRFDLVYTTPEITEDQNFKDKNIDDYVKTAQTKILEIGFNLDRYSNTTYALQKTSPARINVVNYPEAANLIKIVFSANVDNLPFVDSKESLEANKITVLMDVNKNIIQIYGEDVGSKGNLVRTVNLKTLDQVKTELYAKKAKLVNADFIVTGDIQNITIKDVKLGYYTLNSEIIPVYLIKGLTRTTDGYTGDVDLILTAEVDTQ